MRDVHHLATSLVLRQDIGKEAPWKQRCSACTNRTTLRQLAVLLWHGGLRPELRLSTGRPLTLMLHSRPSTWIGSFLRHMSHERHCYSTPSHCPLCMLVCITSYRPAQGAPGSVCQEPQPESCTASSPTTASTGNSMQLSGRAIIAIAVTHPQTGLGHMQDEGECVCGDCVGLPRASPGVDDAYPVGEEVLRLPRVRSPVLSQRR